MAASQRIPGDILDVGFRQRYPATVDTNTLNAINNWDYENGGAVYVRIKQGVSSASIHDIGKNDICVIVNPQAKREFGVSDDYYGDSMNNLMPVIASITGLPSWGPGVEYVGPKEDEHHAMIDHLLRSVSFAGVSQGNYYGGGTRPTPHQNGIQVDGTSANTLYVPFKGEVRPFQPVKLGIATLPGSSDKPTRLTIENINPESIASQMMRSARAYASALKHKSGGGEKLMFIKVHQLEQLRGSVIMRNDVEIGHKFMLGQVGSFLHFYNTFVKHYDPTHAMARTAEMQKAVKDELFSEYKDAAQVQKLSAFFLEFAAHTPTTVLNDDFMENVVINGVFNTAQSVAEQGVQHNRTIGCSVAEKPVGNADYILKKIDTFLSIG
jgi:hypothetical protein